MASLLWPVQAPVSAPGPLEALLSRKQDSINLLTPPSDTDGHLRWRQANSEDIGTVHISEEALNQQRSRTETQAVRFSPRDNIQAETPFFYTSVPFLIFFSAKKNWNWQWWNGLGRILGAMPFLIVGICTSEAQSQMLGHSLSCDLHCILGIDRSVSVGVSWP